MSRSLFSNSKAFAKSTAGRGSGLQGRRPAQRCTLETRGGFAPKIREFKPPRSFGRLPALGSRDTIGDHPV